MKRIGELERKYVLEVLDTDFRSSRGGAMTKRLEEMFAALCKCRFAIAHDNGTSTLHAALLAAGVGVGDEVIVPPLTMASTALAVLHAGAVPIFADIDPDTWNLSPQAVKGCLSSRTRAIMPVALYGLMPDMDPLMEIARERNLSVIEDDAECFLGYYKGRVSGSIGHMGSFSFQSSKHLTAGEGGMVVTNDEALALRVRRINSLGYAGVSTTKAKITRDDIQDPEYARHVAVGFNYRMAELCAAVALAQTERAHELIDRRMYVARALGDVLRRASWLVPQHVPDDCVHSYWTYVVRLADDAPVGWHEFRDAYRSLGGDGIYAAWRLNYLEPLFQTGPLYPGGQPFGEDQRAGGITQTFGRGLCPTAERIQPRLFQFKTNYWSDEALERQLDLLGQVIRQVDAAHAAVGGAGR
jgi:perosamine synthetase